MKKKVIILVFYTLLISLNLKGQDGYFEYDYVELSEGFKKTLDLFLNSEQITRLRSKDDIISVNPRQLDDGSFEIYIYYYYRLTHSAMLSYEQDGDLLAKYKDCYISIAYMLNPLFKRTSKKIRIQKSKLFDDTSDDYIPMTEEYPIWIIQMSNYRINKFDVLFFTKSDDLEKELLKISFKE